MLNNYSVCMKRLSSVVIMTMLLMAFTAQAKNEKISYKIQAGLNLSQIISPDYEIKEGEDYRDFVQPGCNIGFRFDYQFNKYIAIQTGLEYTMRGERIKISYEEKDYEFKLNRKTTTHYLAIPILAGARYRINNNFQLLFNTGPYIAIGLGGKTKYKAEETYLGETSVYKAEKQFFGNPKKENLDDNEYAPIGNKRFDAGWRFELGTDIKDFYIGVAYDLGFVDIANDKEKRDKTNYKATMNRGFSISAGYTF